MPTAALYDTHGNLPALEAVLADTRCAGVDQVIIGGDVLPGPMPRECLDLLFSEPIRTRFIRGNGDREVLSLLSGSDPASIPAAYRDVTVWTAAQLNAAHCDAISRWPLTLHLDLPIGPTLFCHATPHNDTDIFTRLTPADRLAPNFAAVTEPLIVCGHTHMQFDRPVAGKRILNAGSVGMPFGDPGAYWLLLDETAELRRTDYNLAAAAARIRATSYPQADDFAANNVLHPPSEDHVLAIFSKSELE